MRSASRGGPTFISSFHVTGEIFDRVCREADLLSPPAHNVQTTLVPAGGAAVVEFGVEVPGTCTLVDGDDPLQAGADLHGRPYSSGGMRPGCLPACVAAGMRDPGSARLSATSPLE